MTDYGSAGNNNKTHMETFSIAEPVASSSSSSPSSPLKAYPGTQGSNNARSLLNGCCGRGRGETDGFKMIVISMFVFAVGVTVALIITIASEPEPVYHDANVVTSDNDICSNIGHRVLRLGGNAVDAAVASTFCLAVAQPHVTGIGGGGFMLYHSHRTNKSVVIDFRETAPENARNDRYIGNPASANVGRNSIAIPGFVKGLEYAHDKYGSGHAGLQCCSWFNLVWMAVAEAIYGIPISENFIEAVGSKLTPAEKSSPDFANLRKLTTPPKSKSVNSGGSFSDVPIYNKLVKTLQAIAVNGSKELYNGGKIGKRLIADLQGAITEEDLANYTVIEREPIMTTIGTHEVMSSPAPSGGPELLAFLNTLEAYNKSVGVGAVSTDYLETIATILRNLDGMQLLLGDPKSPRVDKQTAAMLDKANTGKWMSDIQSGSSEFETGYILSEPTAAHVAVMDKKDTYVSVVTSLNTWFGSKVMTDDGILMNNAMGNFAIPTEESPAESRTSNQMARGRRPLSYNVVALTMDTADICGKRIVTGGATPGSVGEVLSVPLLLNLDLKSSIDEARIDFRNDTVYVEGARGPDGLSKILSDFRSHEGADMIRLPYTTVNAVEKHLDLVTRIDDVSRGDHTEDLSASDDYV